MIFSSFSATLWGNIATFENFDNTAYYPQKESENFPSNFAKKTEHCVEQSGNQR